MPITIWNGLPGSGKTLKLADEARLVLRRNKRYFKKSGIQRLVVINIKFSPHIEKAYAGGIKYWTDISELVKLRDCDVFIDEVSTYFDRSEWENLPQSVRHWLRLHRHYGIDIYGTTQSFKDVVVDVRRLVSSAYVCRKLLGSRDKSATRPAVSSPWGLCIYRQIDPATYANENIDFECTGFPSWLWISKDLTDVYDTTAELPVSDYPPLNHAVRRCGLDGCDFTKVIHR